MRCGVRFTTYEEIEREAMRVVKRNGAPEAFSREKLFGGIRKACEKRPVKLEDIERVVDEISTELEEEGYREIPSSVIGAKIMRRLEDIDHVAYVRYASVYRQFEDVGAFIDEIISAMAKMSATLTTLLPSASPRAICGSPASAALMDTDSSGLEVANAATVAPTMPGETRAQVASPTAPRTNSSPPIPAQTTPSNK